MDLTPLVLMQLYGDSGVFRSSKDFAAAYSTATDLTLTGMSFAPSLEDFIAVFIPTPGTQRFLIPGIHEFSWVAAAGGGTLTVTDAAFDATETFVVLVRGPERSYNSTTDDTNVILVNPDWEQDAPVIVADVTDRADDTYDYYVDVEGFHIGSIYYNLDNGSGSVTMKIGYSNQNDGTAPGSCTFIDVGLSEFGAASWTGNNEGFLMIDSPIVMKYIHFEIVANTTAADDADWTIRMMKGVLS
jgi:catechol 2,3-dioxygenase-like lactoylglutathione lyase family enzyme